MRKYYPSFYDKFSCLCDACPDTCCAKWEIVVDEKSVLKYNSINGEFGEKLRQSLCKDEDGDYVFRLDNGRCPFLNERNLCDIHINLGREYTCDVCRQHPEFIEEYDDFTEICPSLSCPETVRVIFGSDYNKPIYPDTVTESDDFVLQLLVDARNQIFRILRSECTYTQKIRQLCQLASEIQEKTDSFRAECKTDFSFAESVEFLLNETEILTDEWKELLNSATHKKEIIVADDKLTVLLAYYVYRYFLKAVNDCDIITTVRFILFSVWFCEQLCLYSDYSFEEAARLYSKEIEHNTDNIEKIYEFLQ